MSSNIGPVAKAAYQKYLDAGTIDERIKFLEEFISAIPKHKATENIVAQNKSKLAKLRRESEANRLRLKVTQKVVSPFSIKKEGIQLILLSDYHSIGAGKTSILNYLTGAAKEKIGKFTAIPEIGIYRYQKIRFQIVDMPSLMKDASKGIGNGREILAQVRACDLICLCLDLSRDFEEQIDTLLHELTKADIRINIPPPPLTIEKTGANRIQVFYLTPEAKDDEDLIQLTEDIKEIVKVNGIKNAIVKITGRITLDDVVDALNPSVVYKKALILGTKGDLSHTEKTFHSLQKNISHKFPLIFACSIKKRSFPDDFGKVILDFLNKIKIYTRNNGIVAEKPLIIDQGGTVKQVALKIHRSFFELFDHAIIIREGARMKRKRVGLDFKIKDNDVIELHTI